MIPVLQRAFLFIFLLAAGGLLAETRFDSLDLDESGNLLFQAHVDAPVYGSYSAGFKAGLEKTGLVPLSTFPEQFVWLESTREIQIQNRFGVFRGKEGGGLFGPLKGFPNFAQGSEIRTGKLGPVQTSPDGRYLLYVRDTSPAFGDLMLLDVVQGRETVVTARIETSLAELKARWSPDSRVFIYQKDNRLFYFSIDQYRAGRLLEESLRSIGSGRISCVQWGRLNQLVYVKGALVYEILSAELFTRSLYQDFIKSGRIIGSLPQQFDPLFDRFWLSPDGDKIILDKGGTTIFLHFLKTDRSAEKEALQLPCLLLPGNMRLTDLVWNSRNTIVLLARNRIKGNEVSQLYRLDVEPGRQDYRFQKLEVTAATALEASPDGMRVALVTREGVEFRSLPEWKLERVIKHPEPLHLVFMDDATLFVAGAWFGEKILLGKTAADPPRRDFLFFSQTDGLGFDARSGRISAASKECRMVLDPDRQVWFVQEPFALRSPSTASASFRVYLEQLFSGPYRNMVMVRKTREPGTFQLFNSPRTAWEAFPAPGAGDKADLQYFLHGDRQRVRQLALTFNAIDSVDGLETILETLSSFNVRATFFLNGEFIRRYPWAAREIAGAGHEVANLFHMYFNLSDPRYQINEEFIKQGLSRNEQDYYEATGKELTLLWRTPYYLASDMILKAGKDLKYTLVGRDVDSLDNMTKGQKEVARDLYRPASDLLEMVLEQKKPGSVIAMTVGRPGYADDLSMGRDDYLFEKLDVLVNGLLQKGYSLVPVSELIEALQ